MAVLFGQMGLLWGGLFINPSLSLAHSLPCPA